MNPGHRRGRTINKEFTGVNKFIAKFLTNDGLTDFHAWLVKKRSERYSKNILSYLQKPLENRPWSIKAYRLFLKYLNEKYGIDVSHFLLKMKVPKGNVDLKIPSDNDILKSYQKIEDGARFIFLLLVSSGLRLKEVFYFINNKLDPIYEKDIIVYRLQLSRGFKKAFYLFTIREALSQKFNSLPTYNYYIKLCREKNIVAAKYIRKWVATKMIFLEIPESIVDFIQGRTPRSILLKHYVSLFSISIKYYKKYASWLRDFLQV